jgi:hypothetical protein
MVMDHTATLALAVASRWSASAADERANLQFRVMCWVAQVREREAALEGCAVLFAMLVRVRG